MSNVHPDQSDGGSGQNIPLSALYGVSFGGLAIFAGLIVIAAVVYGKFGYMKKEHSKILRPVMTLTKNNCGRRESELYRL